MTKCMHNPGPVIIHRQGGRDGGGECCLCLYEIDLIPIRLYSILLISPPPPPNPNSDLVSEICESMPLHV